MAVLTLLIGCFFITGAVLQPAAFAESADTEKVVRIRVPACA
jgi:hypothetical protein